ncbi:hypothetical protein GCM10017771_00810 [Streptomyces capitiformicae]|uniref:Uncharacterized protein n=1 Tax=Streptomyces capitiformicae TaxID=2014920 RepID=A0A919L0V5_9ACTN|nr:hypothetical protein GCM10017771_00810 [Streptomyces capitiformicae]
MVFRYSWDSVGATTLTLLLDARTDYKLEAAAGWRGADPHPVIAKALAKAAARSYDELTLPSRACRVLQRCASWATRSRPRPP